MIEQLQHFFKDPAKVTKVLVACFFVAVIISVVFLATLSNDLVYQGGMIDSHRATMVYVKLSLVIGLAFALAFAAIRYQQITKSEIIVYLDKKIDGSTQGSSSGAERENNFNLAAVRAAIGKVKARDEKYQEGLNQLCDQMSAGQGALFVAQAKGDKKTLALKSGYALVLAEDEQPSFDWAEGLIGQVAATGKSLYLDELPEGYALRVESGLGSALPKFLLMVPVKKENEVVGVVELATFSALTEQQRKSAQDAANILAEI